MADNEIKPLPPQPPNRNNNKAFPEVRYRIYINNVPSSMKECEMKKLVFDVVPIKPRFSRLCFTKDRYTGEFLNDTNNKYMIVEFEQKEPADAVFEQLHLKEPHKFDVRVQKVDFIPSGKRHFISNGGHGLSKFMSGRQETVAGFRMHSALLSESLGYGSPPAQPAGDLMGFPALRRMTEGGQVCVGCGSVTQQNCSTCFTPFCSTFCMSKFSQPSHPYECQYLLANPSSPMEMKVPSFDAWYGQKMNAYPKGNGHLNNNGYGAYVGTKGKRSVDSVDTPSSGSSINISMEESVQEEIESSAEKKTQEESRSAKDWKPNFLSNPFFPRSPKFSSPPQSFSNRPDMHNFVRHAAPPVFVNQVPCFGPAQGQMMAPPMMPGVPMLRPYYMLVCPTNQPMMPFDQQQAFYDPQQQWQEMPHMEAYPASMPTFQAF